MNGLKNAVNATLAGAGQIYRGVSATFALIHRVLGMPPVTNAISFGATQFIEGFTAVMTYPATVLKMIVPARPRALLSNILKYQLLYYLLPVIGYYAVVRRIMADALDGPLSGAIGYSLLPLDLLANAAFARALVNAYAVSVPIGIVASTTTLSGEKIKDKPVSSAPESHCMKASFMSPVYYLSKYGAAYALSKIPYYGFLFEYTLKPLAIGESVVETHLSELSTQERVDYFSTHNISNYGTGLAVLASVKFLSLGVYYSTGVSGFWVEDALLGMVVPLAAFHFNTNRVSEAIQPEASFDTFYPVRVGIVDNAVLRIQNTIVPKLLAADQKGTVLESLKDTWHSKWIQYPRKSILYTSFNKDIKTFVETSPIRELIISRAEKIKGYLGWAKFAAHHPTISSVGLRAYHLAPIVPAKEHLTIIVAILTKDVALTEKIVAYAEKVIGYAQDYDPSATLGAQAKWMITNPLEDFTVLESYLPDLDNSDQKEKEERIAQDFEKFVDAGVKIQPRKNTPPGSRGHSRANSLENIFQDFEKLPNDNGQANTYELSDDWDSILYEPPVVPLYGATLTNRHHPDDTSVEKYQSSSSNTNTPRYKNV